MKLDMSMLVGVGVVAAVVLVALLIVLLVMKSWIKVARADEALVVSGKKQSDNESNVAVIVNGKAIVNPVTQRSEIISLRSRQVSLTTEAQSLDNITLNVDAVAIVKISSQKDLVRKAAERFASQDNAIEHFTTEQLEGALRGVIAKLSVSELMRERQRFSQEILDDISPELEKQGLILDSFQIKGITDNNGYIKSLGVPQIQAKRQEAEISETNAQRAIVKRQTATEEENLVEQTILKENQQKSNATVGRSRAQAEQAEALAKATAEQEVLEQQAQNKQSQLDADVRRVAEAERYRREQEAQASKFEKVEAANAEREIAKAEAEATRLRAEAEAESLRLRGEAKADAIRAEAEALEQNREALLAQKALEILPEVMSNFAQGYSAINGLTIIGGGEDGASSHMAGEQSRALATSFKTIKEATGIDLGNIIQSSVSGRAFGNAVSETTDSSTVKKSVPETLVQKNTESEDN